MTTDIPNCAVGAIVLEKGEVLLVRRDRAPALGQWSLPGGRVEWGETLREAVAREVREFGGERFRRLSENRVAADVVGYPCVRDDGDGKP